jgi:MoaE-MoaD fusion protein
VFRLSVTVKLFAGLAERIGKREIVVDGDHRMTVLELKQAVIQVYPQFADEIGRSLVAVNREYAPDDALIQNTDEIAFIPPVGGGSCDELDSCRVVDEPLDVSSAFAQLESVYCGGTVLFVGTVREWTKGRQTVSLQYEAYVDMAIEHMRRIEADVKQKYPGTITLQWHRIGTLKPTEIAVICAAASPHRDVAFEAARMLIERLKKEVPIWKRENYKDGETVWQANEA